ncbi:MAG: hypothetical protein E6905_00900 [Actinomyces sp.]|nr:hypothetical protein [Actinomyces sp.]
MAGEIVQRLEAVQQLPVRGAETPELIEKISEKLDECNEIISTYKARTNISGETNDAIVSWLSRCQSKVEDYSAAVKTYSKAYSTAQVVIGQAARAGEMVVAEYHRAGPKRPEDISQLDSEAAQILSKMNAGLRAASRTGMKVISSGQQVNRSGGSSTGNNSSRSGSGVGYANYDYPNGTGSRGRGQSAGIPLISGSETRHGLGSWMSNMRGESSASIGDVNSGATAFESGTRNEATLSGSSPDGAIRPDGPLKGYLPEGTRPKGIGAFLDQGIAAEGSRLGVGGSTAVMAGGLLGAGAATLAARAGGSGLSGLSLAGPNAAAAFSRGVPASGIVSSSTSGGAGGSAAGMSAQGTTGGAGGMAARGATGFGAQGAGGAANSSAAAAAGRGGMGRGFMAPMGGTGAGSDNSERKSALVGYDVFRLEDDAASEPYESEQSGAGSAEDLHASESEIEDRW